MTIKKLRDFVSALTAEADASGGGEALMEAARPLLAGLIAEDDWLPEDCARPDEKFYRQYLLHCDPRERFSLVSFVWGPGQKTPIHDHTVWGLIGMLRGEELSTQYAEDKSGRLTSTGETVRLTPGGIDAVSPAIGDVHKVENAFSDRSSISIHLYGANIGAVERHVFDEETGAPKAFISGYSNTSVPNLWDRSNNKH